MYLHSVAFVTGAGGALGRATVLQFAHDGVLNITGLDVSAGAIAETEGCLRDQFPAVEFLPVVADITQFDQVQGAIQRTVQKFGRLDHAVNNAAITQALLRTTDTPGDEFDKVLGVNVKGLWHCERAEIKQMLAQDTLPTNLYDTCVIQHTSSVYEMHY